MEINKTIKEAIRQNNLVIFAGSGLSKKFNLPTWKKMVQDIISEIDKPIFKAYLPLLEIEEGGMTPIEVLEKLKNEHKTISSYIKRNFRIEKGDFSLHKKIIDLTGQIITTNFDNGFEKASDDKIIPTIYTSEYNVSEINKTNDPYIFKIHGSYSESDKCIIFREQYNSLYKTDSAVKEKLKSIFINKTILFIGFGFNDPDINLIFENLDSVFGNNNEHFILTKDPKEFKSYKFIKPIEITEYEQIEEFIDNCDYIKTEFSNAINSQESTKQLTCSNIDFIEKLKIAFLYPKTLDIDFGDEFDKVLSYFDSIDAIIYKGSLNTKTLLIVEDFDLVIIVSKVYKSKLYIEEDNFKSNLLEPQEIWNYIPNDKIPVVFITNESIEPINNCPSIYISSFKNQIISRFIYKALKCNELNFKEEEFVICTDKFLNKKVCKGISKITSIYGCNSILDIGKKCLTNVIGRIEEQAIIAFKTLNITKSNKLLNIKASGGTGKTTLVKKVAYELYNRGYFVEGISFKSCESIKTLSDFEEIIVEGFGLDNILNFKEYLSENFINNKIDRLIILDNFESVVNILSKSDLQKVVDLLKYCTDFANIIITSRERISMDYDFEDIYTLTPLITDDALELFLKLYGKVTDIDQIRILREDILEDLLNNNPLAIQLVTNSRPKYMHITELKNQLKEHFFESINEDYSLVFNSKADLNIERTKSIYQSINYSYKTLNNKESIAFELLSLFPDGISLSNFKKCFEKQSSSNNISDKELRALKDKSLIEDYNGTLQLQPIIRRFAEFQFSKRTKEAKQKYCLDAYLFNCFISDILEFVQKKKSFSEALKLYANFKNNLLNVLTYIPEIDIKENGPVPERKYLLNFIYKTQFYIISEKQIEEYFNKLDLLKLFFSNIENAETLINVLILQKKYYYREFDISYQEMANLLTVENMTTRIFKNEDILETRYKAIIAGIHSMEGFTLQYIKTFISNMNTNTYLENDLFYLGIPNNIYSKEGFYFYEYALMFDTLNIENLECYISELYMEEHLEIMQCTYTLSKVKKLDKAIIQKLVVTNPYTKGLKELMLAFSEDISDKKIKYFEAALSHLEHIKYYYLEALYFYCLFLKDVNYINYRIKLDDGLNKSKLFKYQYITHLFENIENKNRTAYIFSYDFYEEPALESYVKRHNYEWGKNFRENEL